MGHARPGVINYLMEECRYCKSKSCVKAGKQKNGAQKWYCKKCGKYQQATYNYKSYKVTDIKLCQYVSEGLGIRSISRLLSIGATTVIRRIRKISKILTAPILFKVNGIYEIDEVHTFIQNKARQCWIIYAINRFTHEVVDFRIGSRAKIRLRHVVESVLCRLPKRIYTDR